MLDEASSSAEMLQNTVKSYFSAIGARVLSTLLRSLPSTARSKKSDTSADREWDATLNTITGTCWVSANDLYF
jgi:hypothetical protein